MLSDTGLVDTGPIDTGSIDTGSIDTGSADSSPADSDVVDSDVFDADAGSACGTYAAVIQPIFDAQCLACHGATRARRGLRLDSLEGVLAGGESGDAVVPCQPDASLLFLKVALDEPVQGHRMPFRRVPLSVSQVEELRRWIEAGAQSGCPEDDLSVCADTTPPEFAGVVSATVMGGEVEVCWDAATDDVSVPEALRYHAYLATTSGAEDYRWTPWASEAGASCVTVAGLAPDQAYCFAARAMDEAGNQDDNVVELCVTLPPVDCVDYAAVVQPLLDRECVHCHSGPDPDTSLSLDSYEGVMFGSASGVVIVACDALGSFLSQKLDDPPAWGQRMPADGPPHLGDAETLAVRRWIDQGARSSCSDPDPCAAP